MLANDMTLLLNKIERRLGLITLSEHLPDYLNKEAWAKVITEDTMVEFSRYFPNRFKIIINDKTCDKKYDKDTNNVWYYVKDEILQGCKLLGVKDIDWTDTSAANSSLSNGTCGTYFYPTLGVCPEAVFQSVLGLQMAADFASLFNRGIVIDFQYPNRFCLKGLGNTNYDLSSFVVVLLVEHKSLSTISPTKMGIFEELAMADVAGFLANNLKYFDGLETVYMSIDLKLDELRSVADTRRDVIDRLRDSYVSASNDECPIIWSV